MKLKKLVATDNARSTKIKKNIFASFGIKCWTILVQLLMVPLTLHCLGVYSNGVWLTISSVLLWFDNLDVGLGNGLRNRLAESLALNDTKSARTAVSSTFAMLTIIILPTLLLLLLYIHFTNVYELFNADCNQVENLPLVLSVAVVFVCSTFVFKCIGNFYMGLQLPAVNNLLIAIAQTLALLGTAIIYYLGIRSLFWVAMVNTVSPLLVYLLCFPVTFWKRYPELCPSWRYVTKQGIRSLFGLSVNFFIIQVSGIVLFMSSNVFISHYFSPEYVTPYQIAYRYFMVLQLLLTIVCVPYWSAITDAYKLNDYQWIRRANHVLNRITLGIVALAILMVLASKFVFRLWIGQEVEVPFDMVLIVAAYVLIITVSMRFAYVPNGFGTLRLQLYYNVGAAVFYLVAATLVAKYLHNLNLLLLLMCFTHLPGMILYYIQCRKLVNKKATGIWMK